MCYIALFGSAFVLRHGVDLRLFRGKMKLTKHSDERA